CRRGMAYLPRPLANRPGTATIPFGSQASLSGVRALPRRTTMMPCGTGHVCRALFSACLLFVVSVESARAQPAAPPPPAKYRASWRYSMPSPRDQHVMHYNAMVAFLQGLHFEFVPPLDELPETDREDSAKNVITGILPSAAVLNVMRYPDIASVLLPPLDYK